MDDGTLHPAQIAAYRRMTPQEKLEQSMLMYWAARELKADALRAQHPDWTDAQIEDRAREIFLHATT